MKKTTVNRLISLLLITSMAIACVTGCGNGETATKSASFGEVWSAPSTVKILQDDADYAEKCEAELRFNAVRNEQESQQLFITASKDIKDYDLKVTDLKSDTAVFSKENITVYIYEAGTILLVNATDKNISHNVQQAATAGQTISFDVDFNVNEPLAVWILGDGDWNKEWKAYGVDGWNGKQTTYVQLQTLKFSKI